MSDIKLFRLADGQASELQGAASGLEKHLQTLIENNLDPLLGIRFLASEYYTGKNHSGRIDTLGLDENNCPVILEYKRAVSENVINQGLFYLDWLLDHKAEFERLVESKLNRQTADDIDWSAPRLMCIASDFTRYDAHAVQQIGRNIDLVRYRLFGNELLLLETAASSTPARSSAPALATPASTEIAPIEATQTDNATPAATPGPTRIGDKSYLECLADLPANLRELLTSLEDYLLAQGDDVQRKQLKLYVAFKRLKNFATIVLQRGRILLFLHLAPENLTLVPGKMRNMRNAGHWGTGDLEISLTEAADLEMVKNLIQMAYEGR